MASVKRGKALVASLRAQPGVRDPEALAAYLGRFKAARKAGKSVAKAKAAAGGSSKSDATRPKAKGVIPPTAHAAFGDALEPNKVMSAAPARKMRYNGKDYDMRNAPSGEVGSPQTFVIDHPKGKDRFVVGSHALSGHEPPPPGAILDTYPRFSDEPKAKAHKGALSGDYDPQQKRLVVNKEGSHGPPDKATLRKLKELYPLATKIVYNGDPYKLPPRKRRK